MKHVILKVDEDKYKLLKSMVREMKTDSPHVILSPVRRGNLGDDIIASFIVKDDFYNQIVEKLETEDISLLGKKSKKDPKKELLEKTLETRKFSYSEVRSAPRRNTPESILDHAIEIGNYEKVIQVSKDYRNGFDVIKKAKDNIDKTISNAIEIAYDQGLRNKYDVTKSLNQLVKIASDRNLKLLQKHDQIKEAGTKAIELCTVYGEIHVLVQICNNNAMPHIICMNAALKLAYVLFNEGDKYEDNVDYIVKHLNLRWLDIVSLTVKPELTQQEIGTYETLISALKEKSENRNNPS